MDRLGCALSLIFGDVDAYLHSGFQILVTSAEQLLPTEFQNKELRIMITKLNLSYNINYFQGI